MRFKHFFLEALAVDAVNTEVGKTETTVIMGRFQPPTAAHIQIIKDAYKKYKLPVAVFIVKSKTEKSPFEVSLIEKILEAALKGIKYDIYVIDNGFIGEFIDILRNNGKEPKYLMAGSDRIKSYNGQIKRYKEKLNLSLEVKEISRSDEDISASKVRQALQDDDVETFEKMTDRSTHNFYKQLQKALK